MKLKDAPAKTRAAQADEPHAMPEDAFPDRKPRIYVMFFALSMLASFAAGMAAGYSA